MELPPREELFNNDEESANKPNPVNEEIDVNGEGEKESNGLSIDCVVVDIGEVRDEVNEPKVDIVTE
jgi:hypothetical protein